MPAARWPALGAGQAGLRASRRRCSCCHPAACTAARFVPQTRCGMLSESTRMGRGAAGLLLTGARRRQGRRLMSARPPAAASFCFGGPAPALASPSQGPTCGRWKQPGAILHSRAYSSNVFRRNPCHLGGEHGLLPFALHRTLYCPIRVTPRASNVLSGVGPLLGVCGQRVAPAVRRDRWGAGKHGRVRERGGRTGRALRQGAGPAAVVQRAAQCVGWPASCMHPALRPATAIDLQYIAAPSPLATPVCDSRCHAGTKRLRGAAGLANTHPAPQPEEVKR